MTESRPISSVTLRALEGRPLAELPVRRTVVATAEAIAGRQGVVIRSIDATDTAVTVALETNRIVAIGFAAELRRLTTSWYCGKYGAATLWGEPEDPEEGEAWKRGTAP